jgi:predicted amidophosphoribosyltransferase
MSNSKPIRNQIRDEELDAFFEEHGQESSTKPWQRADWDEKRSEILADNCAWCESTEDLTVHHEEESPEWWKVWDETRDELFETSDYYTSSNYNTSDEVCPRCSKKGFYHRSTMEPAYRCQQCNHEFDEPGERPIPDRRHDAYWEDMNEFVKNQRNKITTEFGQRYSDHWESYLDLENTVTICKSCHFAWHENNQRICTHCTENYSQYRRDYGGYVCWDCVVADKGLEQCPKCEEKWYNPNYSGLCKNCRIQLQGICPECGDYIATNNDAVRTHLVSAHEWTADLARRAAGPVTDDSPSTPEKSAVCPDCEKPLRSERQLITHLVDTHDWSRIDARKSTLQ